MKPFVLLTFTTGLALLAMSSRMQKPFTEGLLHYDISIVSAKNEPTTINTLNGAELTVYLTPDMSRSEMKSSLGTESTVYNNKTRSGFILKEYSGQKLMITMTEANWDQKNKASENLSFTGSNEVVTIGNYSCKKATATMADGKLFTVYY